MFKMRIPSCSSAMVYAPGGSGSPCQASPDSETDVASGVMGELGVEEGIVAVIEDVGERSIGVTAGMVGVGVDVPVTTGTGVGLTGTEYLPRAGVAMG